jgi:nucleotide-binding universal stress UspA family protein
MGGCVGEKTVVVGMDGSGDARSALMFAMEEAAMRRSLLRVVVAVRLPDYGLAGPRTITPPSPKELVDDVREAAQTYVDEAVAARGDIADGLSVEVAVMFGHPGEVLCSSAAGAELLVVGHRGRGAVASAIIGSVGLHCVLHASCPLVVVRPDA